MSATTPAPAACQVGMPGLLRAEALRSRRTFTWGVIAATAVFALHTLVLAHATLSRGVVEDTTWNGNALPWMHLYPVGFAIPLGLLAGVMAQWREDRWRQGGTAWRAVSPRRVLAARLAVLSASALACQAALVAPVVLDALIAGNGWGPWQRYLSFALVMWIVVSGASAWGMVAYRLIGASAVGAAPVLGLAWSFTGAVQAERADWWMLPWTWSARPVLPLLGVHGSSVILEPGSPVWHYPVLPGLLGSTALAAVGGILAVALGGRPVRTSTVPGGPLRRRPAPAAAPAPTAAPTRAVGVPAGARSVLRALGAALPWRLWLALGALQALIILVARTAYSPQAALGLLALVGLPISSAVVGMTLWASVQAPWRILIVRRGPLPLLASLMGLGGALLVPVLLCAWMAAQAGGPLLAGGVEASAGGLRALAVMPAVSFMMVALSLAVAMRARPVASIVVNAILLLSGLIIGGNDVLAGSGLWAVSPWAWMRVAGAIPGTWAAVVALSAIIGCGALAVAASGARHVAVREGA
ncbi:hypothetical protein J5X07_10985 [Actinomyces bowdenii]|uniref:hypothetical protein n=1 Tax=Actinomyces bowdenii TaxID=131109 RepID=UPI001ABCD5E4|nr:hypothetical protein [Actinomyces bowdenii]MBO3725541.1 hypothetical protein [Actinomyces bowdenii]